MLLVETYIDKSPINGMGLFAGEIISSGRMIWRFQPGFDSVFTPHDLATLPDKARVFIEEFAVLSTETGNYILGIDNVRFANHSRVANATPTKIPGETELVSVANRDIKKGEEITVDYRKLDSSSKSGASEEEYL